MELLPQTVAALRALGEANEVDLVAAVRLTGELVAAEVPSCVGFSYCLTAEDLTFTVVATAAERAALDVAERLDDGRARTVAPAPGTVTVDDVLDEVLWHDLARTTADRAVGSSLSLPVLDDGRVVGSVSFYAAGARAFLGHEAPLAAIVGARADVATTNGDLGFTSRADAAAAPTRLVGRSVVDHAVGLLAHRERRGIDHARDALRRAALRAGLPQEVVARALLHDRRPGCRDAGAAPQCGKEVTVDETLEAALHESQVIDLTTTGRRTGRPRRIEIFLHDLDGRLFISGMPRPEVRAWIHNVAADPHVTIHLKQSVQADVPATARVVTDESERRPFIEAAARRWGRDDVESMMAMSPLIEVFPDAEPEARADG